MSIQQECRVHIDRVTNGTLRLPIGRLLSYSADVTKSMGAVMSLSRMPEHGLGVNDWMNHK